MSALRDRASVIQTRTCELASCGTTFGAWPSSARRFCSMHCAAMAHVLERATLPANSEFSGMLRFYRERAGRTQRALAQEAAVDPSYLVRCEDGDRSPPRRHLVEALARALGLEGLDYNRLMVSAGYSADTGDSRGWTPALQAIADVMGDDALSSEDRQAFEQVVCELAKRWCPSLAEIAARPRVAS